MEWREELLKPTSWTLTNGGHTLVHPGTFHRLRASVPILRLAGQLGYSDLTCLELLLWMNQIWGFPFLQEVLAGSVALDPLLRHG